MGQIKETNIKNQTYYFFDDIIDMKNFHSNLLKIDKKSHKDIDIYYIGYITIKKFGDCENIHSVNPLYLISHFSTGYFKEINGKKYLIIDSTDKHKEVNKNYARIGINTDDGLPFNKPLKFPTLTIIIRCVF